MGKVRAPDETEQLVREHLIFRGFRDIQFEPDGSVPPDFLVDKRIAVEARRLNQNWGKGDDIHGLEEDAIPLWLKVRKIARSYGASSVNEGWFVWLDFGRPVEDWKTLRPKVEHIFKAIAAQPVRAATIERIGRNFELRFIPAHQKLNWFFTLGFQTDAQSGGWALAELERNLKIVIAEKTKKIDPYRSRYPVWWLALEDKIDFAIPEPFDQEEFRKGATIEHDFDRVILINPNDHAKFFEL